MKYKNNNLLYILLLLIIVLIIVLIKYKYKERFQNNDITTGYVINLVERTDRKNRIIENFKDTSIRLEFVNAVRNKNGAIGLGESYKNIVRSHKDLPSILIFEDDCKPLDNFNERWKITKKWLDANPTEWETFGGGVQPLEWVELKVKLENNINLFTSGKAYFTQFTYINSSAYDKILNYDFNVHGPIDHYINNGKYFKFVTIYPLLTFQEPGKSDIVNDETNYKHDDSKFINKL